MSTPRVIVCGTSFGRIYLHAVHEDPTLELAGVLSQGSVASRHYAQAYGVPSYEHPDELPEDIDIACVVVRAGVAGGSGAELSQQLLRRGIHVLQEHLVHPDELAACLRTARENGVQYRLNSFYPHITPIRRFLTAARILRAHQQPLAIDAVAGSQVLYPLLDVIGRAVGALRPWRFGPAEPPPTELAALAHTHGPYTHLHGVIGASPLSLRVQNQIHPADADNHALVLHRLWIVFEGGVLSLADTHGPLIWSPRMHSERDETGRLIMEGPDTQRLAVPSTEILGAEDVSTFHEVFAVLWPDAVRHALHELVDAMSGPADASAGQWALTVTAMWQDLTERLGPPELIYPDTPERIDLPELLTREEEEPL